MTLKILIIGGYGTFGGNIARLLADDSRLALIVAGRSFAKAEAFCRTLPEGAGKQPAIFDRDGDLGAQLGRLAPDIVVDASGPFQVYGNDPYKLVRAAIALGISYMDLADGSDFVAGIAAFDAEARAANVFVLCSVSSFPVLSAAVVRHLAFDMARVESITAGLAPSPHSGLGRSVIEAIASYAGKPIRLRRNGGEATGYALVETRRMTIRPPGLLPLRTARFSLVDVPDLQLMQTLWPELTSVWVGVGTVPETLHRALNMLAWLVKRHVLPSLSPLAGTFYWAIGKIRLGERRSGLVIEVEGQTASGDVLRRSWHVVTEGNDGQTIPAMPVAALTRRLLEGTPPATGARPALRELELEDFAPFFAARTIRHGVRNDSALAADMPLYRRVLADAWQALPEPIRAMHEQQTHDAHGIAKVTRGASPLSCLVGKVFGFPEAGTDIPVSVRFHKAAGREIWTRTFGGSRFSSEQYEGEGLICERFGPFVFAMALVLDEARLRLIVRRWTAFGIPMPGFLAPAGEAYEEASGGRFRFHVEIGLPVIGLIVRYKGWLERN